MVAAHRSIKPKLSVFHLRYHLINTRNPASEELELCEKAFRFWKSSWEKTYAELNVNKGPELKSDDFLDREVGVLVCKNEPIGLFLNNWFDLSRESITSHSYFSNYPSEVIQEYRKKGFSKVMVLSYLTVHPSWRKSQTDIPVSEILFGLGVIRFSETPYENLIGYVRKDLNTHQIFDRHGGVTLMSMTAYNVEVDHKYMTKETMQLSSLPGVAKATRYLWQNRIESQKRRISIWNQLYAS